MPDKEIFSDCCGAEDVSEFSMYGLCPDCHESCNFITLDEYERREDNAAYDRECCEREAKYPE